MLETSKMNPQLKNPLAIQEKEVDQLNCTKDLEIMLLKTFGINTRLDVETAKVICFRLCEKGNMFAVGFKYLKGWDCDASLAKSFELINNFYLILKKYFENRLNNLKDELNKDKRTLLSFCLHFLADFHFYGHGSVRDQEKAMQLYEEAMKMDNPLTLFNYGLMCEFGSDTLDQDKEKAFHYYQRASKLGYSHATYCVGLAFEKGEGVEKSIEKAHVHYLKSAQKNDTSSMLRLAEMYEKGFETIPKQIQSCYFYLFQLYNNYKSTNEHYFIKKYREKLIVLVKGKEVEWKEEYHAFWNVSTQLNQKILTLLLISKHRRDSHLKTEKSFLIRGVVVNMIKYLCHFSQYQK